MPRPVKAVLFDVDGTLVDSEQAGHRVAFNEAFKEFGIVDRWDEPTYRQLLAVTGGRQRLLHWFSDERSELHSRPTSIREALAESVHRLKTDRFEAMARYGRIPARAGVEQLLDALAERGIRVGVVTTGSRRWVHPLLEVRFCTHRFACVVTGDDVARRKPSPEAYLLALSQLGLDPSGCVAVEDSGPGLRAARAAGLPCVVVVNEETDLSEVRDADLVVEQFSALQIDTLDGVRRAAAARATAGAQADTGPD